MLTEFIFDVLTYEIEHHDFLFQRPVKDGNADYSKKMRSSLIEVIKGWLGDEYDDEIVYAITIEEIEVWVLTAFENSDTSLLIVKVSWKRFWQKMILPLKNLSWIQLSIKESILKLLPRK